MVIAYQRSLSSPLYTVQAYEERWWPFALSFILLAMLLDAVEYEGDAMLRLVVDNLRHFGYLDGHRPRWRCSLYARTLGAPHPDLSRSRR